MRNKTVGDIWMVITFILFFIGSVMDSNAYFVFFIVLSLFTFYCATKCWETPDPTYKEEENERT